MFSKLSRMQISQDCHVQKDAVQLYNKFFIGHRGKYNRYRLSNNSPTEDGFVW